MLLTGEWGIRGTGKWESYLPWFSGGSLHLGYCCWGTGSPHTDPMVWILQGLHLLPCFPPPSRYATGWGAVHVLLLWLGDRGLRLLWKKLPGVGHQTGTSFKVVLGAGAFSLPQVMLLGSWKNKLIGWWFLAERPARVTISYTQESLENCAVIFFKLNRNFAGIN